MARGFASLSKERRTELARKGALAAHARGTAYEWTSAAARIAGAKGGRKKPDGSRMTVKRALDIFDECLLAQKL